jgi:hypothetical protein
MECRALVAPEGLLVGILETHQLCSIRLLMAGITAVVMEMAAMARTLIVRGLRQQMVAMAALK